MRGLLPLLTTGVLCGLTLTAATTRALTPNQQRGDTTVRIAGPPRHAGVASLVPEVSIGGASATADEYIFSNVSEVRPLPDGSMVLIDAGRGTAVFVRMYDANGRFVRTLGRRGEGPGEYMSPSGLGVLPDGTPIVRDGRGGRLAAYERSGEGRQIFTQSTSGTSVGSNFITVSPDGVIMLMTRVRAVSSAGGPGNPSGSVAAYLRLRADGTVIDTLAAPLPDLSHISYLSASRNDAGNRASTSAALPFSDIPMTALSPLGYFVTASRGRYSIDLRVPNPAAGAGAVSTWREDDRVLSIRRTVTPVPVSDAERTALREGLERRMRNMDPTWRWTAPDIPRAKPPLSGLRVGLDGRIWVQLSTPSERFDAADAPPPAQMGVGGGGGGGSSGRMGAPPPVNRDVRSWREPALFDVYEPDGTYIGQVRIPYNTELSAMRGDHAWGTTRDADGVTTVHRFRIAWNG